MNSLDRFIVGSLGSRSKFRAVRTGGFDPYDGKQLDIMLFRCRVSISNLICWSVWVNNKMVLNESNRWMMAVCKRVHESFKVHQEEQQHADGEDYCYDGYYGGE